MLYVALQQTPSHLQTGNHAAEAVLLRPLLLWRAPNSRLLPLLLLADAASVTVLLRLGGSKGSAWLAAPAAAPEGSSLLPVPLLGGEQGSWDAERP